MSKDASPKRQRLSDAFVIQFHSCIKSVIEFLQKNQSVLRPVHFPRQRVRLRDAMLEVYYEDLVGWGSEARLALLYATELSDHIRGLKLAAVGDELIASHLDRMVGTSRGAILLSFDHIVQKLMYGYFRLANHDVVYLPNAVDSTCESFANSLKSSEIQATVIAILEHLSSELDKVEIMDSVVLHSFQPDELVAFLNEFPNLIEHYRVNRVFGCPVAQYPVRGFLVYRETLEKHLFDATEESHRDSQDPAAKAFVNFRAIVDALRVHRAGGVRLGVVMNKSDEFWAVDSSMTPPESLSMHVGGRYHLNQFDIEPVGKIVRSILESNKSKHRNVAIGLRRISRAVASFDWEEKVIDYCIGLEALLLTETGPDRGDLGYRLRIRAALLLGENEPDKMMVMANVADAYRIRSKIVHGGLVKPKDAEIIPILSDIARDVANKYVQLVPSGAIPDWDKWLLSGTFAVLE